jgi:hypothetical protein
MYLFQTKRQKYILEHPFVIHHRHLIMIVQNQLYVKLLQLMLHYLDQLEINKIITGEIKKKLLFLPR